MYLHYTSSFVLMLRVKFVKDVGQLTFLAEKN